MTQIILLKNKKALVIRHDNPQSVIDATSKSGLVEYTGKGVFAVVSHTNENTLALRKLGIEAPAPISHYYEWPGRFTPRSEQRQTAEFLTINQKGLVLNEMGTGKTISSLWAAHSLYQAGLIKKVLIVSPLSTLERVWADEIFANFPKWRFRVLYGSRQKREKLLREDADVFITNHDGFKMLHAELFGMFDLVISDEASVYRNYQTDMYKKFFAFVIQQPEMRVWMLTGTPTPNAPTDAWALGKLVGNPHVPATFRAFQEKVMRKKGMYKWEPKETATHDVQKILQPSIRFSRAECFELPPTTMQTREVPLTKEQQLHFSDMIKTLIAELAQEQVVTATNEMDKRNKLLQICCGVIINDAGKFSEVDCEPRINEMHKVIKEMNTGKTIVFASRRQVLYMLEREILNPSNKKRKKDFKGRTVGLIHGGVTANARNDIFKRFQTEEHPQVLVAHPKTMAHGLTLTKATGIIWYGPPEGNEIYMQANARIERPGKGESSVVVMIQSTDLERQVYERLEGKQRLEGVLLDFIRRQTEDKK